MAEETPSNLHWSYKTPLHPCHSRWHCQLLLLQEMAGLLPYTICDCLLIHLFICSVKSDNHEHTKLPYFNFLRYWWNLLLIMQFTLVRIYFSNLLCKDLLFRILTCRGYCEKMTKVFQPMLFTLWSVTLSRNNSWLIHNINFLFSKVLQNYVICLVAH